MARNIKDARHAVLFKFIECVGGFNFNPRPICMKPGHEKHLCKLILWHQEDIENIKPLFNNPKYICTGCGRVANASEDLCTTIEL